MKSIINKVAVLLLFMVFSCRDIHQSQTIENKISDLEQIRQKGKISVVTDYNSTDYFIYRGQPMGFQFDLLQDFSDFLGVKLEVTVSNDLAKNFEKLEVGDIDLIASNLTVTKERKERVAFTTPHSQSCQVLVQRKPEGWERMNRSSVEESLIRNPIYLAGKTIYVQKNSSHAARLRNLSDEIGDSINIVEVDDDVEILISKVASGEIGYTISDENVAQVNQTYYSNIDVDTKVSFPQNFAWAVNKHSVELKRAIDTWLTDFKNTKRFKAIYARYYSNNKSAQIVGSEFYALNSGKISQYDKVIKKYSSEINWDWRLVASLIYQESRFKPDAISWAGAFGLMQLMPGTAQKMGVDENASPMDQIKAGIELIKWLEERFSNIQDKNERIKFVLASYNVGLGHVIDAQNLALKDGKDPNVWDDCVDQYLLKKSNPEYFNDPVVKYGYCRGVETYNYVAQILDRYEHYKNIVQDN